MVVVEVKEKEEEVKVKKEDEEEWEEEEEDLAGHVAALLIEPIVGIDDLLHDNISALHVEHDLGLDESDENEAAMQHNKGRRERARG